MLGFFCYFFFLKDITTWHYFQKSSLAHITTSICLVTYTQAGTTPFIGIMKIGRTNTRTGGWERNPVWKRKTERIEKKEQWTRKGGEDTRDRRRKIRIHAAPSPPSPQSTLGSIDPAFFTIISDTGCLILILLVKKYLSRYKNKPTANYKLSGLKISSCLCGGGWEDGTDMNHSPAIWVFPWHQWAPVQDSVEVCEVPKRQRSQREARRWTHFFFPRIMLLVKVSSVPSTLPIK